MELKKFGKEVIYRRLGAVSVVAALILSPIAARAATIDELNGQLNQTENQISQYEVQVEQHQHAAANLEQQLANMRYEAAEIQSKINATEAQINEINERVAVKKTILAEYIRQQYRAGRTTELEMLVESESISEFMNDQQYLQAGRSKIEGLLAEIAADKKLLDEQKASLGKQQDALAAQQRSINDLLAKTRGEQSKYESLLAKAKASRERLDKAMASLLATGGAKSYGYVVKGQQIGREGSTGFSTGAHLHLSAFTGGAGSDVSPWPFINSGKWRMPLDNPTITQDYNAYNCNGVYTNCRHNGIDMSSGYGSPVRAVASGNIVMNGWDQYGFGHYIVIDHGDGFLSLYGHMIR